MLVLVLGGVGVPVDNSLSEILHAVLKTPQTLFRHAFLGVPDKELVNERVHALAPLPAVVTKYLADDLVIHP